MSTDPVLRSLLFVPGDRPERVVKALASEADAIIVDLEDAVALANKSAARANLKSALEPARRKRAYVRVNPMASPFALDDFGACVAAGADGIVLTKVESAAHVAAAEWLLDQLGASPDLDLILVLESAAGLAQMRPIMKGARRAKRANIGAGDLSRDLNLTVGADEAELGPYRALLVAACRAHGFHPPLDTVWGDLSDEAGLRASAERAKRVGFSGKLAIHPRQLGPINAVFSPSGVEVERARKIAEAFRAAEAAGNAAIEVDGTFVDYPVAERAEQTLALAKRIGEAAS